MATNYETVTTALLADPLLWARLNKLPTGDDGLEPLHDALDELHKQVTPDQHPETLYTTLWQLADATKSDVLALVLADCTLADDEVKEAILASDWLSAMTQANAGAADWAQDIARRSLSSEYDD